MHVRAARVISPRVSRDSAMEGDRSEITNQRTAAVAEPCCRHLGVDISNGQFITSSALAPIAERQQAYTELLIIP